MRINRKVFQFNDMSRELIREDVEKRGLTQEELAEKIEDAQKAILQIYSMIK